MTMSNKTQTAVSWLFDQLPEHFRLSRDGFDVLQIAKAMEKQQIINAVDGFPLDKRNLSGLDYYNETYVEK
jgi:hypothetical protein